MSLNERRQHRGVCIRPPDDKLLKIAFDFIEGGVEDP